MSYKLLKDVNKRQNYHSLQNKENFEFRQPYIKEDLIDPSIRENNFSVYVNDYPKINPNYVISNVTDLGKSKDIDIRYDVVDSYSTASPPIFGPPLWFSLHNAAAHYPDNPTPITIERMKNVILGIPVLVPCTNCSEHASAYIESNYDKLNTICSGRDNLFKFFVDFHNYVNKRYNKPIMSYEDAYKMYLGNAKVTKMTYS